MTLTEDEIKDIIKVISSFKNRVKILKCATEKMISKEGGLLKFLVALMEVALPLIKHVLKPLSKSVLVLFGLSTAVPATDAATWMKIYGSGMATLKISNKEMKDIMKIVKYIV